MSKAQFQVVLAALTIGSAAAAAAPEFRNTDSGVRYVGSQVCAGCHSRISRNYRRTGMGRSVTRPDPRLAVEPATVLNEAQYRVFRVFAKNGELYQSESETRDGKAVFEVVHKLEYAIGSGANGVSFAVRRGEYLFQAPLSWYKKLGKWDLSPGFAETGEGFGRPVYEGCIACHAGRVQAVSGGEGRYRDPPLAEMAVGCEKCHGPGELHVAERQRGTSSKTDTSIVNPARLSSTLAGDICMQCHQRGDTRVLLPGKNYESFRPGTPLLKAVALFGLPSRSRSEDLLQHHSSMESSRCYRASGGKLTCLTCHDPHEQPDEAEAPSYFAAKCLSCHAKENCPKVSTHSSELAAQCVNCHMQKRDVRQISHAALTDHRIPARPNAAPVPTADRAATEGLILLNPSASEPVLPLVTRLEAYGEMQERAPELREEYLRLLEAARSSLPEDPLVLAALGRKALRENSPEAVELLQKSEKKGAASSATYVDLSEALTRGGRDDEAVAALHRATAAHPFSAPVRKHLILNYIRRKEYGKAVTAMQEYLEYFPEDSFMRGLLDKAPASARP